MQPNQQTAPAQPSPQASQQKQPPVSSNPNSTQNSLEIASIRDGVVIMNDGSFRAVVMAKSINFDLMSGPEQDAVEYAYMGFLNSLYFDIQITLRSRKIDMRPYLEKLDKVREETDNLLLGMLMEDYIFFIDDLVQQTNIMSKQFYVIVPYSEVTAKEALSSSKQMLGGILGGNKKPVIKIDETALEHAKTELTNRVQSVVDGLQQFGVQSVPLDTQELIELYYNFYNPDTATRQTLQDTQQITVPLVTKGEGHAPKPDLPGGV